MFVVASARLLFCCALVLSIVTAIPALTEPKATPPGTGSLCVDNMETDPDQDDWEIVPVNDAVDGGCMASLEPIST